LRFPAKFAFTAAVILMLVAPPSGLGSSKELAINRDGDLSNPIKVIRRLIVRLFDDLTAPHP